MESSLHLPSRWIDFAPDLHLSLQVHIDLKVKALLGLMSNVQLIQEDVTP